MTATNGWPGKPGVPLNPEKDGPHWIYDEVGQEPALWNAKGNFWQLIGTEACFSPRDMVVRKWRYLGPVLPYNEATALQARVAELETALQFIKDAPEEDRKPNLNNMGSYEAGLRYCAAFARAALEGKKE